MSLILNGANQFVAATSGVSFAAGRYLAGWVRATELSGGILVASNAADTYYALGYDSSTSRLKFYDVVAFSSGGVAATVPGVRDVWTHVGIYRVNANGGENAALLVVNGLSTLIGETMLHKPAT